MNQLLPYVLPAFLSSEECGLVRALLSAQKTTVAKLSGAELAPMVRSAQTLWLDDDTLPWLTKRLVKIISQIVNTRFLFTITGLDEGYQLLKYQGIGEDRSSDFYDWHVDIGQSGYTRSRKLSIIIQLSPKQDYSGGELEINHGGTASLMEKNVGTLIAFPSFVLHRVKPVLTGERLSLAIWAHGPNFQ